MAESHQASDRSDKATGSQPQRESKLEAPFIGLAIPRRHKPHPPSWPNPLMRKSRYSGFGKVPWWERRKMR